MANAEIVGVDRHSAELRPQQIEGWIERACQFLCNVALAGMVVLIGAEAIARVAGVALEMADEVGAYLLVAVTFLSLSVCQATQAFHHLDLVQPRLSPRGRAISAVVFDLVALGFSAILLWQLAPGVDHLDFRRSRPHRADDALVVPAARDAVGRRGVVCSAAESAHRQFSATRRRPER